MNELIEEVRAARESLAARYDYDVEKLAAALAERSKVTGRRNASLEVAATANPVAGRADRNDVLVSPAPEGETI
ncbi:MAG: hypothetical protein WCJ31_05780 [Planctomycetia bacterium]